MVSASDTIGAAIAAGASFGTSVIEPTVWMATAAVRFGPPVDKGDCSLIVRIGHFSEEWDHEPQEQT